ncbi:Rhomboid family protein [Handroanthus impetiginosus]|uniref:RHOMBOID-like protein n=1 Tax=Handroanthus impetiginosus TaxID=429701 RepID=A0A2G9I6E4_9LAMI|nr:Rhomboid family protein [Handroanthus impetiginosus]PIN25308.1 Rhomboid family protein [Handroanthus impetiginosus]
MGRTPIAYSPESELPIKVQPRRTDPHPMGGPHDPFRYPPPPPPRLYHSFKKWFPWLVPTIIIVNIVFFVIAMYINDCPAHSDDCVGVSILGRFAFQNTRENPLLGPSAATLLKIGALEVQKVVEEHQAWRLVSCMWLHAGTFHVVANMLSLLFVGIRLEQEFGFVRVGLLYVISGIGGSLASSLFVRTSISVGASGALFGLLGAMLSELLINWTIYENKLESLLSLVLIILINMAVGILPHVDNFAHLGGFVTGFLLGFVLLIRPQYGWVNMKNVPSGYLVTKSKSKYRAYQYTLLIISVIILTAGFTVGLILLLGGVDGNKHCSWCHYLSCVPTPLWTCEARCTSSQYENELYLTCIQNNKSKYYLLGNGNSTSQIQQLCVELCS